MMKDDLFALTSCEGQHPLWQFIRDSNASTGSGIVFDAPRVSYSGCGSSEERRHVFEEIGKRELMYLATVLFSFLKGSDFEGRDEEYEPYMEVLNFVTANKVGTAMALVSGLALKSVKFIPTFATSSRLPGFIKALSNWTEHSDNSDDWRDLLSKRWRGGNDPFHDDYVFRQALNASKDSAAFAQEIHNLIQRRKDAERKKKARGKLRRQPEFKDRIRAGWILGALWTRSPFGILQVLEADDLSVMQVDRITADISRLGLAEGRSKSVHEDEAIIETAEENFRKWIDRKRVP
ncbi:MAG: hypothetical protein EOP84_03640 [Verrucomicrobiaceae bacterium]|nr:MAG: hypothetical protein EOP84_03640 [Verrucomicrobiaceae bacterium]